MVVEVNKRLPTRLKNFYYSLYEVELEISQVDKAKKTIITSDEYDYIQSLELRKQELETNIKTLLNE